VSNLVSLIEFILRAGESIEKEYENTEVNLKERHSRVTKSYSVAVPLLVRTLRRKVSISMNSDLNIDSLTVNGHQFEERNLEWKARKKSGTVKKTLYIPTSFMNAKTNEVVIESKKPLDPLKLRDIIDNVESSQKDRSTDLTFLSESLGKEWDGACEISLLNNNNVRICRFPYIFVVSSSRKKLIHTPIERYYIDLNPNYPKILPKVPKLRNEGFNFFNGLWFKEYFWEISLNPGEKKEYIFFWRAISRRI